MAKNIPYFLCLFCNLYKNLLKVLYSLFKCRHFPRFLIPEKKLGWVCDVLQQHQVRRGHPGPDVRAYSFKGGMEDGWWRSSITSSTWLGSMPTSYSRSTSSRRGWRKFLQQLAEELRAEYMEWKGAAAVEATTAAAAAEATTVAAADTETEAQSCAWLLFLYYPDVSHSKLKLNYENWIWIVRTECENIELNFPNQYIQYQIIIFRFSFSMQWFEIKQHKFKLCDIIQFFNAIIQV